MTAWPGVIEAFRDRLPVTEKTPVVTLLEGNTPLIKSWALSQETGAEVYLKVEGANPTGSFKDRGMTLAVSKALEAGSNAVICASTGNTSSSAAAYAARAGIKCAVLIPEGMVAAGKLAQGAAHGATVIEIEGNFDQAIEVAKIIGEKYPVTLVNSLNPHRIQGQKTAAFEICDTLHRSPDFHLIPVGNAGNITAYHIGYSEYAADGRVQGLPKMFGFQAAGAAPIVTGKIVEDPQTIASAIRIGNPASWDTALKAADETGGAIKAVTDEEIVESYKRLASRDGVFVEPASAASVAGLMKLSDENVIAAGATVVCTLTGHGLKDPDRAIATADKPQRCRPEVSEVVQALGF